MANTPVASPNVSATIGLKNVVIAPLTAGAAKEADADA